MVIIDVLSVVMATFFVTMKEECGWEFVYIVWRHFLLCMGYTNGLGERKQDRNQSQH